MKLFPFVSFIVLAGCSWNDRGIDFGLELEGQADAGSESEAESESESEGEPRCGDGACGIGEDDGNCLQDCGCAALPSACSCGVAPAGCFCGVGCVEFGSCCDDACEVCGSCESVTVGCGDGTCHANERGAVCPFDCGLPPDRCEDWDTDTVLLTYRVPNDSDASIELQHRLGSGADVSDWTTEGLCETSESWQTCEINVAGATTLDVWARYWPADGSRARDSCNGLGSEGVPQGELGAVLGGVMPLTFSVTDGDPYDPEGCAQRFTLPPQVE